jgi:hypothetical protein
MLKFDSLYGGCFTFRDVAKHKTDLWDQTQGPEHPHQHPRGDLLPRRLVLDEYFRRSARLTGIVILVRGTAGLRKEE